jgi:hypothetical protein
VPEISRFFGIVIGMFFTDHAPPHFHVRYGEYKAAIDIRTLAIMEGRLPPRALGLVMEWAALHQQALLNDWALAQEPSALLPIPPLE